MDNALLYVKNIKTWYRTHKGYAKVLDGVEIYVKRAEKVGLVGESGCGKTTTMKTILKVLDSKRAVVPEGEILFDGKNILKMKYNEIQQLRRTKIAMISQEPMAALNPVFTIEAQLLDVIKYSAAFNGGFNKKEAREIAINVIKNVMISDPERILKSYPHQLSGGMRQRICIAMALVSPRELLIADEPGTALDVTIQDQIHRLLRALVEERQMSLIMITHSLGVARELVDRIYVMYAGNIVENAITKELFNNPLHPYTQGLMECVPRLSGGGISTGIYGYVPDYTNPIKGCRFYPRCSYAKDICRNEKPKMVEVNNNHMVACFKYY